MRVLISTTQHLLHLDTDTRAVTVLENHEPEYYGITWKPGSSELVLSHSGVDNATLLTLEAYARSEQGWISFPGGRTERFLSAPHQILWCSDNRIVSSNTGRNRVVAVDPHRSGSYHEAGLSAERWDRLAPTGPFGDHLNSVFETEGKLYVIAHRHSQGSKLAIFSYPEMRLISAEPVPGRTGLHNIFVGDGLQLSCHSEAAAIVDLASEQILWEAGTPIYTRGMGVTDDHVFVGESAKTGRDLRRSSLSGLWVLDRRTWKAADYFPLGPYGAVHDVRVADVPDHAHHGTPLANPELLLNNSSADTTRRQRLESAETARRTRSVWRGYDFIFADAATDSDGWRDGGDTLNLAVLGSGNIALPLAFDYGFEKISGGQHVSLVTQYRGGGDSHMQAVLIQPQNGQLTASYWIENGTGWHLVRQLEAAAIPKSGRMAVSKTESGAIVTLNGQQILILESGSFDGGRSGIRWVKASVRPVTE